MNFRGTISPVTKGARLAAVMLFLSVIALVLFGLIGIGRGGGDFAHDMRYLFVAGEMWEAARSPYDFDAFRDSMMWMVGIDAVSYAYPPNSAPLSLALSAGSVAAAKLVITALNLAAIAILCAYVFQGAAGNITGNPESRRAAALISAAVVIGNPFSAHVIWMGQTSLISAALLYAAWLAADRRSDAIAGVLLGLAAFKPQLAFLVGLWFILDRRWLLIAVAAATTIAVSLYPIITTGFEGSWLAWLRALADYQGGAYNLVSFRHVFGLRSLLASIGITVPSLMPLAIMAVIGLYWIRHHYEEIWLINAILILSFLLLYAHDYDLAAVACLTYPLLIATRARPALLLLICVLASILFFPQRIWEKLDLSQMARSRELALMALLGIYLVVARTAAGSRASPATVLE